MLVCVLLSLLYVVTDPNSCFCHTVVVAIETVVLVAWVRQLNG